ncbi:CHAT domain-containing protein [Coleofasciculus sp. E1-EBD-02]|uniref:CHAT domain-containing protein n=1 Tax=Coleofasciculus sp. E1-EBD-02 TaxID=3068481 RepID=UPI0032FE47F4
MGLTKERWHLTKLLTWLTENRKVNRILLGTLVLGFFSTGVEAQPVVPANDGTNTQVGASGNKFTITGGQTSGDGANLFHSFSEFGLDANQTANFITNPDIQTILSRVTGGNASLINGLIQVTGGNSNLFLMNPAGIVFGQNARLDVPASFTATTATGIGFGENWFSAIASNDYTSLVGQPDAFTFNTSNPGAIVNGGNLEVGKDLSLVGGTVVSTGNIEAPNGQITITTVPGESTIRLSQPGHLLSLEVPATETSITPLSLPELLTGSVDVPDVGFNSSGTAEISASKIPIESGDIVAKNVIAETATLSAQHNLTLVESQLQTTGDLNLLAQDTVRVRDSVTNPFLAQAGDNLYIQGNNTIDILALNHPQTPFQSGGNLSLVSDGDISGDAHFTSGGHFSLLNLAGNSGNFFSYFDPIISSNGDVTFGNYTGVALKIESTGSITGNNIKITGPEQSDGSLVGSDPDIAILTSSPALILRAGLNSLTNSPNIPGQTAFTSTGVTSSPGNINVNNVDTSNTNQQNSGGAGPVIMQASGDITTGSISTSDQGLGNGGLVRLHASGNITIKGNINTSDQSDGDSGSVELFATFGNITIGDVSTSDQSQGNSGSIDLISGGNILAGSIDTGEFGEGDSGSIALVAGGNITHGSINQNAQPPGSQGQFTSSPNTVITDPGINPGTTPGTNPGTTPPISLPNNNLIIDILQVNTIVDRDAELLIDLEQPISGEKIPIITYARTPINPEGNQDNSNETNTINPEDNLENPEDTTSLKPEDNLENSEDTTSLNPEDNLENPEDTTSLTPEDNLENSEDTTSLNPEDNLENSEDTTSLNPEDNLENSEDTTSLNPEDNLENSEDTTSLNPEDNLENSEDRTSLNPEDNLENPGDTTSLNPEDNLENPEDRTSLNPEDNLSNPSDTTLSEPTTQPINSTNPSPRETNSNPSVSAETPSNEANSNSSTPANNSSSEASSSGASDSSLQSVDASEENFTQQFVDYLGLPTDIPLVTLAQSRDILGNIEKTTGVKPALLYISFVPQELSNQAENPSSSSQTSPTKTRNPEDQLELLLVTANGLPIRKRIPEITRQQVLNVADQFRLEVTNVRSRKGYIAPGKQLYDWLVAPMDDELQALGIENVTFLVDYGLRSVPIAALYDGQQFLIEKYSVGLMPSLSLVNPNYAPIENLDVLAMGAAQFTDQKPLPAVPVELSAITQSLWQGKSFLNETFTLENLKEQRQQQPFGIIHLATHANFQSGEPNNSYIQLWDRKLRLNQLPQLDWNNPPVELLVLSACRTALGNEEAELGFAGLAVQSGAKSAVGSLWYVSDEGTLGLMTQLYQTFKQAPIKAEALRQTQLAMLQGQVYIEGGQLIAGDKSVPLPPELARLGDGNFEHPYYWSAFTMVGSPW